MKGFVNYINLETAKCILTVDFVYDSFITCWKLLSIPISLRIGKLGLCLWLANEGGRGMVIII